jgi:ElaB/YqjD/DUF883 family membrane-anchored ribosome-binding protein
MSFLHAHENGLDRAEQAAHHTAESAEQALQSTQRAAAEALDGLAAAVHRVRKEAAPALGHFSGHAADITQQGAEALRHSARQLRLQARRASRGTVAYIQDEPVKAVLIAAATGVALTALLALLGGRRDHR